jgi:hypothetical protein
MHASLPSLGNFAAAPSSPTGPKEPAAHDSRRWLRRMWWGNLVALVGYLLAPSLFALVNDRQTDELFRLLPFALVATQELLEAVVEFQEPLLLVSLAGVAATMLYRISVPPQTAAPLLLTAATALVGGIGLLTAALSLGGVVLMLGIMVLSWLTLLATLIVVVLLLTFGFVAVYLIRWLLMGF